MDKKKDKDGFVKLPNGKTLKILYDDMIHNFGKNIRRDESMVLPQNEQNKILRTCKQYNVPVTNIRNLNICIRYRDLGLTTASPSLHHYTSSSGEEEKTVKNQGEKEDICCIKISFFFGFINTFLQTDKINGIEKNFLGAYPANMNVVGYGIQIKHICLDNVGLELLKIRKLFSFLTVMGNPKNFIMIIGN